MIINFMFNELSISSKYFYHNCLSILMIFVWLFIFIKGYKVKTHTNKNKISKLIITICLAQEILDYINRIFLDSNYIFSVQRDLPFLQFCQISFYFSLLCIFLNRNYHNDNKYYSNNFLFDCAFLLGFSGAFQGIITPDFFNINNLVGVICIQLQHSLIILNLIWLMTAFNYRLRFKGVCLTYIFINIIAPLALIFNHYLGTNINGDFANYFYVIELPKVDTIFLNYAAQFPSPEYILYMQPVFIIYFIILYLPFAISNKIKKN